MIVFSVRWRCGWNIYLLEIRRKILDITFCFTHLFTFHIISEVCFQGQIKQTLSRASSCFMCWSIILFNLSSLLPIKNIIMSLLFLQVVVRINVTVILCLYCHIFVVLLFDDVICSDVTPRVCQSIWCGHIIISTCFYYTYFLYTKLQKLFCYSFIIISRIRNIYN